MTVHDELGHILLESRHYLTAPEALNPGLLLQSLKNTNMYLLREYEQDDTARDALADAVDMAETIGVEVTIAGRAPAEEPGRSVLAAAIQESAAKTVKHAGGSALTEETDRAYQQFAFKGAPEFVSVLTSSSVEAANVANNHTHDYGDRRYAAALYEALIVHRLHGDFFIGCPDRHGVILTIAHHDPFHDSLSANI